MREPAVRIRDDGHPDSPIRYEGDMRLGARIPAEMMDDDLSVVLSEVPAQAVGEPAQPAEPPVESDLRGVHLPHRFAGKHAAPVEHAVGQVHQQPPGEVTDAREHAAGRVHRPVGLERNRPHRRTVPDVRDRDRHSRVSEGKQVVLCIPAGAKTRSARTRFQLFCAARSIAYPVRT